MGEGEREGGEGAGGGGPERCVSFPGFVNDEPTPATRGGGGSVSRLCDEGGIVAVWRDRREVPVEEYEARNMCALQAATEVGERQRSELSGSSKRGSDIVEVNGTRGFGLFFFCGGITGVGRGD